MTRFVPALALAALTMPGWGQVLSVADVHGAAHLPLAPAAGRVHLLLFLATDCPVSNRYAPEIARIVTEYAPKGVRSYFIYADPRATRQSVLAHLGEFYGGRSDVAAIIDTGLGVTGAVGARVTPEAAIYTVAGRAYRGRIDDLYISLGRARRAPTRRDLRLSLDRALAGLPVPVPETQAVGCYIERGGT